MNGGEAIVFLSIFIGGFAMIFGIVYLKTRENMAMIDRGMNPKRYAYAPRPFWSLKFGLLLMGVGVGLFIAFMIDNNSTHLVRQLDGSIRHREFEPIYFGLITAFGGLGLVASYLIEKKYIVYPDNKKEELLSIEAAG